MTNPKISPIDAMADAIMAYEGWKPGTRSYTNRNPGNLKQTDKVQPADTDGFRIFHDLREGYAALGFELLAKCLGYSKTQVTPASTILQLFETYAPATDHNTPAAYARFVTDWMSEACGITFTSQSKLSDLVTPPPKV